jgi:hypothetical protein
MFAIKNFRFNLTTKLDNEIGVLKKQRTSNLLIEETEKNSDNEGEHLKTINIKNIPTENVWIFDNEFGSRIHSDTNISNQKNAFTSAGKKVEKTIIYHDNNRLYILMIEMKRTISPWKYRKDVVAKFEQSLSTLSVFISAHLDFTSFENTTLYPIGICCYNYYKDTPDDDRGISTDGGKFRETIKNNEKKLVQKIVPISLNQMMIPVLVFKNPNNPVTESFDLDFNDFLKIALEI